MFIVPGIQSVRGSLTRESIIGAAIASFMLLVFGGLLLLGNMGMLWDSFSTSGFIRRYWPFVIIAAGVWRLISNGYRFDWQSGSSIGLGIAVLFFNIGWFRLSPRFVLPLALIAFGIVIVLTIRQAYRQASPDPIDPIDVNDVNQVIQE